MRQVPSGQRFKHANKRRRVGARRKQRKAEANPAASTVLFETFEPRVLLDASVPITSFSSSAPANGTVLASDTAPATVQDADGTSVNVSITGNGHWQIVQETLAPTLTVTGTDTGSAISITTTGGDGRFLFSGIDVEGPAASLTGTGVDLNGGFKLAAAVSRLLLGDLTVDASSSVTMGSASTNAAAALTVGETTASSLALGGGSTLASGPSVVGDQAASAGSSVTVSGVGTLWQVNGGLTVGEAGTGSQLSVSAGATAVLDTLTVGDKSTGGGTVSVAGRGTKLSVSGLADFGVQGNGVLTVQSGAVVTLGNATFGDNAGSVGQVTLSGAGSTLNVAGTLTLGGAGTAVLTLGKGTAFHVGSLFIGPGGALSMGGGALGGYTPTVGPIMSAGLNTFASGTATNGTTADPTVSGRLSAANTLISLRAGLGSVAPAAYEDITANTSGGGFTVSAADLAALNGGTLPDGRYVLHLIATDAFGIQATADIAINLQTAKPTIQGFGLAQSSAVGGTGNVTANGVVTLTGTTAPGASIVLVGVPGASTIAGANGVFQFTNIAVASGDNTFTATATNGLGSGQAQVTVTRQGTASADVAMQWNQVVVNTIANMAMYATDASRLLAIVSLAQYDTLAAIEGTPAYMVQDTVSGPVSEQAALAQTAYEVLVSLFPRFKPTYDAALAISLQGIPSGPALNAGLALGTTIADTIVALRKNDGSANFVQYDGGTAPGQWAPTAPSYLTAVDPQWGSVTPFAIASADALVSQIGPPPALGSAAWAASLNQIASLGSATSTTRTADQTQMAQFWSAGTGTPTPAGLWNSIAQTVSQAKGLSLSANVRMFALLNTALADTGIAEWDIKYTFGAWRPIQAVPVANTVNPSAVSVPNWLPLLVTPAFPEYASGHASYSGASATILASIFGDNTSFSLSVANLPGVVRNYTSFTQASQEAGLSRIYGGIHFLFSIQAGWQLGADVANQVLARFAQKTDTQPPNVILSDTSPVTATNITLNGQVVDNLSGVAGATISVDGGTPAALALDSTGHFSFTTTLRLDGSNDGNHAISIVATDIAGNVASPANVNFTLDTQAPTIALTSLNNADNLTATSRVTGTVSGTGSPIVAFSFAIDGGVANPIAFNATTGAYDQALPVANLAIGAHVVTLTAQDSAGNVTTLTRNVNVAALGVFQLAAVTPGNGETDVGVTYRPRIDFTRAVNPASLTSSSFFATDSSGNPVAATIAPAGDGSFAYLLFKNQLPGASAITLHVVGSLIRAAADGAFLDAAGNGAAGGSDQTYTFVTVSTTGVTGTVIKGIVADPGPDLTPGTFDDSGRGPDGIPNTPDDIYKLPIANAKVTILGSNITVFTDAHGYFEIDNAPAGDVKLAIDGRTATNPPAGYFFPEMVMDLTIKPGVVNTPMDSMGMPAEQLANKDILGTFLPRVLSTSLTTISSSQPTTVTTDQVASPNLTGDQVGNLSLTIAPGSALDQSGNPVSNVQVGIATVPAQLVMDMLPPGVTQHTFDITIQAPGVAVFTSPAIIKFPNVFNAAPGTKLSVLSFDHTTGKLVFDGYATVSADGKFAISDPGQGVTTPGWHGLTPPGPTPTHDKPAPPGPPPPPDPGPDDPHDPNTPPDDPWDPTDPNDPNNNPDNPDNPDTPDNPPPDIPSDPPPDNPPPPTDNNPDNPPPCPETPAVPDTSSNPTPAVHVLSMLTGDTPTPDQLNAFTIAAPSDGYVKEVTVSVDPQLGAVLQDNGGDVGLSGGSWVLNGGDAPLVFDWGGISDANLFAAGLMNDFSVYGGAVTITETTSQQSSPTDTPAGDCPPSPTAPVTTIDQFDIFRYLNPVFAAQQSLTNLSAIPTVAADTLPFPAAVPIGDAGASTQDETLLLNIAADAMPGSPTVAAGLEFSFSGSTATFAPVTTGTATDQLQFLPGVTINLSGIGVATQKVYLDRAGLISALTDVENHTGAMAGQTYTLSPALTTAFNSTNVAATADAILTQAEGYFTSAVGSAIDLQLGTGSDGSQAQYTNLPLLRPSDPQNEGGTVGSPYGSEIDNLQNIQNVVADYPADGFAATRYLLSDTVNANAAGSMSAFLLNTLTNSATYTEQFLATTIAHEIGHTLSLVHIQGGAGAAYNIVGGSAPFDVMAYNYSSNPAAANNAFLTSLDALDIALNQDVTGHILAALNYYDHSHTTGGSGAAVNGQISGNDSSNVTVTGKFLNLTDAVTGNVVNSVAFGSTNVSGGAVTENFVVTNYGTDTVTLQLPVLTGSTDFSLVLPANFAGPLAAGATIQFGVRYTPHLGPSSAQLKLISDAAPITLNVSGQGTATGPALSINNTGDNLGGAQLGKSVTSPMALVLHNYGSATLHITGLSVVGAGSPFRINGASGDLSASPITITPGGSYNVSVTFSPTQPGLQSAVIQIRSDDPAGATVLTRVDGTGAKSTTVGNWGNNDIAVVFPTLGDSATIHTTSDAQGRFSVVLPPSQRYTIYVYDPTTGLIATRSGITAPAGQQTDMTSELVFRASTARDTTGSGVPDDIKQAIGPGGQTGVLPTAPPTTSTSTDPIGDLPVINPTYPIDVHVDTSLGSLAATDAARLNYALYVAQTKLEMIIGNTPDQPALITGAVDTGRVVNGLRVEIESGAIDGAGGTLAKTELLQVRADGMPALARITLDSADLATLVAANNLGALVSLIEHEMLHALGFGDLWSQMGLVDTSNPSSPGFTGPQAVIYFNAITGSHVTEVPLDNRSGASPIDWNEQLFGNEAGTPLLDQSAAGVFINGASPISAITAAALADMGYVVDTSKVDAYTLPTAATPRDYRATAAAGTPDTLSATVAFPTPGSAATAPPTSGAFAFGDAAMGVLPGYTNVHPGTVYTAVLGYGFQTSAGITAAPPAAGKVTSNYIDTDYSAFRIDVANGTYDVYITLGDDKAGHTNMYYYEQNIRRGVVTTLAGEHVMVMNRVEVTDGHLDLQFLGGDSHVALNAISFVRVSTFTSPANGPKYAAGRYYVAMENLNTGNISRMQVDLQPGGSLCPQGILLAPNTPYREYAYNVNHNTVGYSDFVTSASGTFLLPNIVMGQHLTPTDPVDGLESLAQFIIGIDPKHENKLGIQDLEALRLGLDPTGGTVMPTGVVGSQNLTGTASAVAIVGSNNGSAVLSAYVATGISGLSIVDVTQVKQPVLLSEMKLPGDNTDIVVDPSLQVAALAGNGAGLNIVNIADSKNPVLLTSVLFPDNVVAVNLHDGIAYVLEGTSIATVDLTTFEVRASLDLSQFGATTLVGMASDSQHVFAIDANRTIWSVGINGDVLTKLGSLGVPGSSGKITLGGTVLYVPVFNGFAGGYQTVDVSNPAAMALIAGTSNTALESGQMVLNGTGLGIAIGSTGRVNALDVIDVSNPANTGAVNGRIPLPLTPMGVALADGFAFVADGGGGLKVVNYAGIDVKGVAPTISISSNAVDIDPGTPGIQVVEGAILQIHPTATDDVQIRNIELLVNGQVVANDVAYPFDFSQLVPAIATGGTTMTIQARATDTGGNSTLSNIITLNVVPDTVPPTVVSTSVTENASVFFVKSLQVNFNKRIDNTKISAAGVTLINAGPDGVIGTADDTTVPVTVSARPLGQTLSILLASPLPAGKFQLTVSPSIIFDTHGNQLANPVVVDFTVRPASDVKALSGVAAITQEPSANPGQTIGIAVPFDPTTAHMTFAVIDTSGNKTTRDIATTQVDLSSSKAFFQVPLDAVTGTVVVYGLSGAVRTDFTDGTFPLEIVPIVTSITVSSVASDGSSANVQLRGRGFIEANNSSYNFGTTSVVDTSPGSGPDVFNTSVPNDTVNLTVPLNAGTFGPISVTTTGGTSAPLVVSLTGIVGTALSGTPANAALPSANPGQAVTLTGSGLGTSTGVIMTYTGSDGVVRTILISPASAAADGSMATFIVPSYANGVTTLSVLGSSSVQTLQIVPTLTSYAINSSNSLRLFGTGLQEGSATNSVTYNFTGATVTDTAANAGPDVQNNVSGSDNTFVDLAEPVHGFGSITTTTAGGTSAPLTLNEFETGLGLIRAIAYDPANPNRLWVADNANPASIHLIDITTGQPVPATPGQVNSIPISNVSGATNDIGDNSFFGSMQIVPQNMSLSFTPVSAGSLLVFYGPSNPDYVVALDPTTGNVISSLTLSGNYDSTAGVYDPNTAEIFMVDRNHSGGNRIVALDPVIGTEDPAHTFNAPFTLGDGGLALDPSNNGTFWLASDQSGDIVQVTNTGTVLRHLTIGLQAPGNIGASGIAFDAAGNLLVSTNQGIVLKLNVNADYANTTPTLTAINGTATNGTPANAAIPSADAGQVITLTGSNFNAGTEVLFAVRDASGNTGLQAVTPLAINPTGTSLQVQVPTLATTGAVQVVNVSSRNLGFNASYNDALYRGLTVQFTANSTTSAINFADGGLEGIGNESWGIDNVSVTQGVTTIFADNFESGVANAAWTQNVVDTSTPGVFTNFLGRFSNGGDTLNLTGLTAGQTYTLHFDLYAIDSLDGLGATSDGSGNIVPAQYGPDLINVTIDGSRKLSLAPATGTTAVQNFNGSATLPLQIVPTLTGMDGSPSGEGTFNLFGSGFQAGAMTVTVGGVTLPDSQFANQNQNRILGGGNSQERIVAPLVLDGPVTISTAGGSATLPGFAFAAQPPVQFTGITATAGSGVAANAIVASANTGQTITLNGQGFTNSTLVLFPAEDSSGATGQVVRTGTAGNGGTTLSVVVPELARTGAVQVMGNAASYQLQIVPVLRSVGGTVQSGKTIELEASGLPPGEVTLQIDGRGVGTFSIKDTYDVNQNGVGNPVQTQQILTLVVPPAIGPGVITVQTNGGIATLQAGVTIASQPGLAPAGDAGDTIATATNVTLPVDAAVTVSGTVGDGVNGVKDVDLYAVTLAAGEELSVQWSGNLYSHMRLFNAAGQQLATQFGPYVAPNQTGVVAQFTAPVSGTYYLGISGYPNSSYDPTIAGSGTPASYTGPYALTLERLQAGGTRLSSITATASSGTPVNAGVPSAIPGQTITLNGSGLQSTDQVVFTSIDDNGSVFTQTLNPATVAADGTSLTVIVPSQATTGTVRLARDPVGLLLQVVPTLSHIDMNINGPFNSGGGTVSGSGFSESTTTLNFGGAHLIDTARDSNGLDIYNNGHNLNFTTPNGVSTGPFSVTTLGGTSSVYSLSFTGITATPLSGIGANNGQVAANPGQLITLSGSGFDATTDIVFTTVDDSGNRGQVVVHPISASLDGTSAIVGVPGNAMTGVVRVVGDVNGNGIPLQIVPTITGITVNSVASDGSSASVTLRGTGFVDGYNTAWTFGGLSILDASSVNQGPDVFSSGTTVNLTVPLNGAFGPILVTTQGGTSAALTTPLTGIVGTAMSGTPANAALASANPGQAVTLTGSGLNTSTGVIMTYTGSDGGVRTILLNPSAASADGHTATLIVPSYANGVTTLGVLGSGSQQTLQIVPTLSGYSINGVNSLRLYGTGLQEGSAGNTVSYDFTGGSVSDTSAGSGPDVQNNVSGSDNTFVDLAEPVHGFGTVTTTTAGGTSAPLTLNEFETGDGLLRSIAMNTANPNQVWVGDNANPAALHLVDITTGQQIKSIAITQVSKATNTIGNTSFFGALQVLPTAMTLRLTPIPAGTLLVFYGPSNPDYVVAMNPTTGNPVGNLPLLGNYDTTAGVYDPTTNEIFLVDRNHGGGNRIVGIYATTTSGTGGHTAGTEDPAHTFASPFNLGDGALALDPSGDGTLWLGSDQSGDIVHITNTGTILKTVSIFPQAGGSVGVSGMVFDGSGNLLIATNQGVVVKLNVNFDAASFTPTPTLTAINGTATNGTPANGAIASADAGQVITLTGSNFTSSTEVVFQTRDGSGNTVPQAVTPMVINAAGTSLQVQVPTLATTGAVQVVNVSNRNLGFNSYNDAIYRGLTVQFVASSATSAVNFADGGLEGINNESWGIDNVSVTQGVTTIFSDNFESGQANAAWSINAVDSSTRGVFSDFLGRFSNNGDTLNLAGLTAGQVYTLHFDLYAIDSLDGLAGAQDGSGNIIPASFGPDRINVTIDGSRKLSLTPSYVTSEVQNFNGSATLPLQIVPVLSGMDGSPSGEGTFNLFGSGFQAGAMTVTVGGVTLSDSQFTNQFENQILGGSNGQDRIVAPLTLDGPVTVTTAGGSATLPGFNYVGTPGLVFSGITATAGAGIPAAAGASANIGQTIVLNGQGFTNSTLVVFSAEDASGTHGTVTRTGSASADGRSLSIVVPELARTGNVTVLGSGASFALQVVPLVRSVGGAVATGNTIELETTGVTPAELTVTIDGQNATVIGVRDTVDVNTYSVTGAIAGQQLLKVTVPAGVSAGVITVSTPGGASSVVAGVAIAAQPDFVPSGDAGDTLATATAITLPVNASINIPGTVGDGVNGTKDVDLYQVTLAAQEQLNVTLNGNLYSIVRFFNAAGQQLGTQSGPYVSPNTASTSAMFTAPTAGTYYVGISGYNNNNYDPTVAGSGTAGSYTGAYTLTLEHIAAGGTRISSISATAASGTPAIAGVASANIGATITLNGVGLVAADQVVFTGLENGGNLYSITVNPTTVAVDGSSLTVVVPGEATTGTVRLARDDGGILLQIVPTVSHLDITTSPQLNGSGFAEGLTTLNFGTAKLADTARDGNVMDVYNANQSMNFGMPDRVEGGPFSVTTPGGTSAVYPVSFTGITATATSGTAANAAQASANAGQTITITGTGLDTSTDIVFRTIDDSGNRSQVVVHPTTAAADGTSATVVVPGNAITDVVRVIGDSTGNDALLQIVPIITSMTVTSVASDGSFAGINLHGSGLIEGNNSAYMFGGTVVTDAVSGNQGPDVFNTNTQVNLSVPLNPASYGPVTVTTAGGTSAPLSLTATLTVANATATTGTPANAALPSANPGQTITLTGSGLTTSTGIIGSYTGSDGIVRFVLMNPATAAVDGSSATLVVPSYFNGITQLGVIGAANPITLQIVPVLTSAQVIGTDVIRLFGSGLQEGSAVNTVSYNFAGGSVSDTSAGSGPDVQNHIGGSDNNFVDMTDPVHGFGTVTTTTAGGTSAPMTLNEMEPVDGYLRDVAMDPANPGQAWIADNGNPAKLHLVNLATGADIRSITLTSGVSGQPDFGSTSFFGGMQIVPVIPSGQNALTLNGVAVPTGSILLFDGTTNPDRIIAVDPTSGQIISTLTLTKNYDMTAGIYDPFSGNIYITDRTTNPTSIVAINPANGAEIAGSRFNLPVNAGEAGLALDPAGDGTFWYGSDQSNNLYHLAANGTILKTDDLTLQGIDNNEINGLSFDNNGKLLVASRLGMVYRVTV